MRVSAGYKTIAAALALTLTFTGCSSRMETAPSEAPELEINNQPEEAAPAEDETVNAINMPADSFEAVTSHINFYFPDKLTITRPQSDVTVSTENYYINGFSDVDQQLLVNGEPVEVRGKLGSFGVYVSLESGENIFTFEQGEITQTVTITRETSEEYATTDVATRMRPEINAAARAGEEYTLSCVAPSGAEVSARIGNQTVMMTQTAATAVAGIPATFTASLIPEDVEGTIDLGPIVYTVEYSGTATDFVSSGNLFIVGMDSELVVRGLNTCSTVFSEASEDGDFYSTLVVGGIDVVTEIGDSMYRLGMGGWIRKDSVEILTDTVPYQNSVASTRYHVGDDFETLTISGSAVPPFRAQWGGGVYSIRLYHTTGLPGLDISGSGIFSGITAEEEDGDTVLTFTPQDGVALGGYLVEYNENETLIYLRAQPAVSTGLLPLEGITVAVDPGHGGSDEGAFGVAWDKGPAEKDINLATAVALQKYLQSLGAQVFMLRESDERVELDDRLRVIRNPTIDLMISLHCNSVESYIDGTGITGTETYYYEDLAGALANTVNSAACDALERKDRGAKQSNYRVTLNSCAPSVMIEMGFLTNPQEYDSLCSKEDIYTFVLAVGDAVVETLDPEAEEDVER